MTRPPVPHPPADGHTWTAAPAGPEWRPQDGGRCRATATRGRKACGRPGVLALNRGYHHRVLGTQPSWWVYCDDPDHGYGRWVENGQVLHWRQVPL